MRKTQPQIHGPTRKELQTQLQTAQSTTRPLQGLGNSDEMKPESGKQADGLEDPPRWKAAPNPPQGWLEKGDRNSPLKEMHWGTVPTPAPTDYRPRERCLDRRMVG